MIRDVALFTICASLICAGMTLDHTWKAREAAVEQLSPRYIPEPSAHYDLADYFQRKGSPHPERMATAVLETKKPRLLAAIAAVESQGKESAKNRKSGAKGAFQVKSKFHGRVSKDAVEQALQADRILDDLYDEKDGNLRKALNAYGGDTRGKYAKQVLAELQNVPR